LPYRSALALDHGDENEANSQTVRPMLSLVHSDPMVTAYRQNLPLSPDACPVLGAALCHVLSTPGSLIRMRVAHPMAMSFGMEAQSALDAATALEYFHTASLIVDDLPCMDDASQRRGASCVHLVFGEHEAILVALALINRAYALAWKALAHCSDAAPTLAMEYLERLLGLGGLLSGQSRDLNFSRGAPTAEAATMVARGKTVSLIRLSLVWPALVAGAGKRELQLLERISLYWGLAYQAADDLKDVLESPADSGKTTARDALLERPNLAIAIGTLAALARLERLLALGDGFFRALLFRQPSLGFLEQLRYGLDADIAELRAHAGESLPGAGI
jgi:geranylgeranyl diphosphate synthase, type II